MGYSLQYCLNECGNAVPGNECDWEDGVCDACRERREDEAKGETMAGWTPKDTEALLDESHAYAEWAAELTEGGSAGTSEDARLAELFARAAAHIEDLEERVAELELALKEVCELAGDGGDGTAFGCVESLLDDREAERANAIPRAVLVSALRERGESSCGEQDHRSGPCPGCWRGDELIDLADEIERGEWPKEGE